MRAEVSRTKCLVLLTVALALAAPPAARADLASDIQAVLADKLLQKATVGVEIVRLGKSESETKNVYQFEAQKPLTPASNLKLTTTSAALDKFGPDFKFRTTLALRDGNLILIGDGDPTLGDGEYLRRVGWTTTTVFEHWADQLKKLNITSVRNVIVDDSVFDEDFLHPHWPADQIHRHYVAQVGGVNFNQNCVDFYILPTNPGARVGYGTEPKTHYVNVENSCITGQNNIWLTRKSGSNDIILKGEAAQTGPSLQSVTIHDPPMYAATVLSETLASHGVQVTGQVQRERTHRAEQQKSPGKYRLVAVHETPLTVALARANKDSVNLYAESLCKRLGFDASRQSGSWENGTAAVAAFLRHAGVPEDQFKLDDGSGLSKQNVISPHALVRVLTYDFHGKNHEAFLNSLAVAGVDGTLDDRFRGTDLRRRVFGKSGFVEGVSCLSGYLKARDGQWYAFSIMMNGIPRLSNTGIKTLQERIVKALDAHTLEASARR